jgi:hypothetical protein
MGAGEFEEKVLNKLAEIHDQVLKTNGRVTALEKWRTDADPKLCSFDAWKNRIVGGLGVTVFVLTFVIIPVLLDRVKDWLK